MHNIHKRQYIAEAILKTLRGQYYSFIPAQRINGKEVSSKVFCDGFTMAQFHDAVIKSSFKYTEYDIGISYQSVKNYLRMLIAMNKIRLIKTPEGTNIKGEETWVNRKTYELVDDDFSKEFTVTVKPLLEPEEHLVVMEELFRPYNIDRSEDKRNVVTWK